MRFSLTSLLANAFSGHRKWTPHWRDAAPKDEYDIIIVGGGGHGLATAYYLAREYGVSSIPRSLLFDKKGALVEDSVSGEKLEDIVKGLLGG